MVLWDFKSPGYPAETLFHILYMLLFSQDWLSWWSVEKVYQKNPSKYSTSSVLMTMERHTTLLFTLMKVDKLPATSGYYWWLLTIRPCGFPARP